MQANVLLLEYIYIISLLFDDGQVTTCTGNIKWRGSKPTFKCWAVAPQLINTVVRLNGTP